MCVTAFTEPLHRGVTSTAAVAAVVAVAAAAAVAVAATAAAAAAAFSADTCAQQLGVLRPRDTHLHQL